MDPEGTSYYIYDEIEGYLDVYIVHHNVGDGITGSRFAVPKPECLVGTYIGDAHVFPTSGNSQTGVTIMYGDCLLTTTHVLTVKYYVYGLTPECCWYWMQPFPGSGVPWVEESDCSYQWRWVHTGSGIINPDPVRYCGTPVEPSTWGKVKALYQ